jgi:hypothetical protein
MKSISKIRKYAGKAALLEGELITDEVLSELPTGWGIYVFRNRRTKRIDYVGTATGKNGLRQRIRNQHLRRNYLKSVFRIKLGNTLKVAKGEDVTDKIVRNYLLGFLLVPEHVSLIKALEQILIYEYSPKFNSETAKHSNQIGANRGQTTFYQFGGLCWSKTNRHLNVVCPLILLNTLTPLIHWLVTAICLCQT